jgi:hypothetical protein
MKQIKFFLSLICLLLSLSQKAKAWDLEIGVRSLLPRIGANYQEYKDKSGETHLIKPTAETTATGFSYHLGLRINDYSIDYDASEFGYDSSIEATNEAVTEETEIRSKITEQRLGVNYHIERELAGMFVGIGFSNAKEELTSAMNSWTYETTTPYLKVGLDLILGVLVIRYEQIYLSLGEHSVQINSAGLLLIF